MTKLKRLSYAIHETAVLIATMRDFDDRIKMCSEISKLTKKLIREAKKTKP